MKTGYSFKKFDKAVRGFIDFCEKVAPDCSDSKDDKYEKNKDAIEKELLKVGAVFSLTEDSYPSVKMDWFKGWGDWYWKGWPNLEEFIEWKFWSIVDKINDCRAPYNALETYYAKKPRMAHIIKNTEEEIDQRMVAIDTVMDEYQANQKAWNEDHHDKKGEEYQYDRSNRHDYNGNVGTVRRCLNTMKMFAEQPIEAYLKVAVEKYVDSQWKTIINCLKELEGIAFRASLQYKKEKFYNYLQTREAENVQPKHS